jgi:FtsZ-interacting cell division protein ZipA
MENKILFVILLTVIIVIGANGFWLLIARNRTNFPSINLMRQAFRRARDPWQKEKEDLETLSQLVDQLKDETLETCEADENSI